jgi:hypothetical protein
MCIVCNQKEAMQSLEDGLEAMAQSLAEMTKLVKQYCPLAVPSERLALRRAEALLAGDAPAKGDCHTASQEAARGVLGLTPEQLLDLQGFAVMEGGLMFAIPLSLLYNEA